MSDVQLRPIIEIDAALCDGCGLCIPSCAEGAIQLIDGKARLVSDALCDGLGNCLGECPQGAIRITKRDALPYDEQQVNDHLQRLREQQDEARPLLASGGCPGSTARLFTPAAEPAAHSTQGVRLRSQLRNWPIELMLVPEVASFYAGADVLISADCVPFAEPNFHADMLEGRVLMIACPKLDKADFYIGKLERIFRQNDIASVTIAFMEVPCCFGLVHVVRQALQRSGKAIDARAVRIGTQGGADSEIRLDDLPF